jgi:hypothetical protein
VNNKLTAEQYNQILVLMGDVLESGIIDKVDADMLIGKPQSTKSCFKKAIEECLKHRQNDFLDEQEEQPIDASMFRSLKFCEREVWFDDLGGTKEAIKDIELRYKISEKASKIINRCVVEAGWVRFTSIGKRKYVVVQSRSRLTKEQLKEYKLSALTGNETMDILFNCILKDEMLLVCRDTYPLAFYGGEIYEGENRYDHFIPKKFVYSQD